MTIHDTLNPEVLLMALLYVVLGSVAIYFSGGIIKWGLGKKSSQHTQFLLTRVVQYTLFFIILLLCLMQLGVDPNLIVGTAGVLSVGFGFAAKELLTNIFSGLILLSQSPFKVGDMLRLDGVEGFVQSVGLTSVSIACHDNAVMVIPNTYFHQNTFTNVTEHPIRRVEISVTIAHHQNLDDILRGLESLGQTTPEILDEPTPLVIPEMITEEGQVIQCCVWALQKDFLIARIACFRYLHEAFAHKKIDVPHRRIHVQQSEDPTIKV